MAILVALAVVAYLPYISLGFIADDYHQIPLAKLYASQGWGSLLHDVNLRSRATYMWLSVQLDALFGFNPAVFHAFSVLLHVLSVLAFYGIGVWAEIGENAAFWAASLFAIHEGHQEAVAWPATAADLLVFVFGMAALVCWIRWVRRADTRQYVGAGLLFLAAMASKESAWVFAFAMTLPVVFGWRDLEAGERRRVTIGVVPFLVIAFAYVAWTFSTHVQMAGYHDDRFSLSAPWMKILSSAILRLLLPWGFLALGIIRKRSDWRILVIGFSIMIAGLLPVSFMTYSMQIPSRLTYTAGAGMALLAGVAMARLQEQGRQKLVIALAIAALAVNLEILWVKKMSQFRERTEPTDLLIQAAAKSDGKVTVACFPLPDFVAADALKTAGVTATFPPSGMTLDANCFEAEYHDKAGHVIHQIRRLGTAKHGTFY